MVANSVQFIEITSRKDWKHKFRKRERSDKGNHNNVKDEFIPALCRSTDEFVDATFDGDSC